MPEERTVVCRDLAEIVAKPTAHNIGMKQVLLANEETPSNITQIARTVLQSGEAVEPHIHKTMDEHYLFTNGTGIMQIDGTEYQCKEGMFFLIPAGMTHGLKATSLLEMITIGVALQ